VGPERLQVADAKRRITTLNLFEVR
jgi:hypothetical protein